MPVWPKTGFVTMRTADNQTTLRKGARGACLALLACWGLAGAQQPNWQREYALGMASFDQREYADAAAAFEKAIACDPAPRLGAIDYLPWLYLAVSQYHAGNITQAQEAFAQSRRYGMAERSVTGGELYARYRAELTLAAGLEGDAASPVDSESPRTLSQAEVDGIRDQVLRRCALAGDIEDNKLPWYFHYLFGEALMEAGDPGRALDAFTLGANVREEPKRNKRMYGMWYVDYLPYFQIATAHARLGHWAKAQSALEMSSLLGEFTPEDPNYPAFLALEQQVRGALGRGG